jgi:hydroxypyruvate reductase
VPDAAGVDAARRALGEARAGGPDDLLLALVSGGGSALWPAGAGDVTLDDMREVVRLLLRSGAAIDEINTVRKHLSLVGGGRLAEAAHPAELLALVISDVVGDDLSVIASGPTVPDATTFADAERVLRARGPWDAVPARVRRHVEAGVAGAVAETVKPGAGCFARARTVLAGGNRDALAAARAAAARRGYAVRVVSERLVGEAREVGAALAREALDAARDAARDAAAAGRPVCLLWGGETTVTVRGAGRGGRNQELALAAALALDGAPEDVVVLSGGTDGVDGPTDAAGGWATPRTAAAARAAGLDPRAALDANDSHTLLHAAGALVVTGPTHTNVMDVQVALARPRD